MKIYTRRGDDGTTGLLGAGRVLKSAPRVEAYGSVDELNAVLGVARAQDMNGWLAASLDSNQNRLFAVGAELASTTPRRWRASSEIDAASSRGSRRDRSARSGSGHPLPQFSRAGREPHSPRLSTSRAPCAGARAACGRTRASDPCHQVVHYLNRLADLLFVMARWANHRAGVVDLPWHRAAAAHETRAPLRASREARWTTGTAPKCRHAVRGDEMTDRQRMLRSHASR
jgi:cob(I)alamin adenosyltransferase